MKDKNKSLVLSYSDIKEMKLSIKNIIDEIKSTVVKHANNEVYLEPKITLRPREGQFYTAMPGGIKDEYLGLKLIERFDKSENTPGIFGTLLLNDEKTGKLLSIMDATWLTSIRTGAIAAITMEKLAQKGFDSISIIGLGNTAMASLICIKEIFPDLKKINILAYKDAHNRFMKRFEGYDFEFNVYEDLESVIKASKVVITSVTYAGKPFVKKEWLQDGVLAIPIHARGWQECDPYFDKVYTDDYGHTKHFIPNLTAELGEVVAGYKKGRESDAEKIIAYNIGMAIDDIAVAKLIYKKALIEKKGVYIDIADYNEEYYV
ncbi:ornithine cyclodeaminase family protein [Psychrilyobacter atlanticus]|uniref:ornithine cyclodeaminase family protein n=1 Tax=Psychrilyobacter atlanticus TaxID=271091 RepID=UPI0003FFBE46|nr:ornithine cyclodeaminase family protein [Psychrilyobacter atlanticus]